MDSGKIHGVQDWEPPWNLKDVCTLVGFANIYCCFVYNSSRIVQPLTLLTWQDVAFTCNKEQQKAFDTLQEAFTLAPVLAWSDPDHVVIVETDASDHVSAIVLSLYHDDGILHAVACFCKKHSPAKCNFEIYDKELMATVSENTIITYATAQWCCEISPCSWSFHSTEILAFQLTWHMWSMIITSTEAF